MTTPRAPVVLDDPTSPRRGRPRARRAVIVSGDVGGSLGAMGSAEAVMGFTDHEIAIARTAIALSLTGLVENTATAITELTAIDLERSRRGDATGAKIGSTLSRLGRALAHRFNEAVHAGGGNRLTVLPMASSRRADDLNAVLALGDDDDELQAELAAADTGTQETEDAS